MNKARPKVGVPTKDIRACNKATALEKRMKEKEDLMNKIRGIKKQDQCLGKGLSNTFEKKFNNYVTEKQKKIKHEKDHKKPIFKFYHVDNTFGFNFYNEPFHQNIPIKFGSKAQHININSKPPKNVKTKDLYSHVQAKVDTGLKRSKITQKPPDPKKPVEVQDDIISEPSLMTRVKKNRGTKIARELVNIMQSSLHTSYNLRQTPARLSSMENKSENVKTPKMSKHKKEAHAKSSKLTPFLHKLSLSHHSILESNATETLDILNQSHQNLGEYPQDGSEDEQVNWFKRLYKGELKYMETLSGTWSEYIDDRTGFKSKLKEEVVDDIRTAVGTLELFKRGRFKQFGDLIEACEYKTGAKMTKPMDLMGFWEMIQNQIVEIRAKFIALDGRKANDWAKLETPKSKTPKRRVTKKKVVKQAKLTDTEIKSSKALKLETKGKGGTRLNIAELKAKFRQNAPPFNPEPVEMFAGISKLEPVGSEQFEANVGNYGEGFKENLPPSVVFNDISAMQTVEGTPNLRRSQRLKRPLQNLSLNDSVLNSPSAAKFIGTPSNGDNQSNRRNTLAKLATYFPEMSPIKSGPIVPSPLPKASSKRDRVSFGISSHVETEDEKHWPEDLTINTSRRSIRRVSRLLMNSHFLPPIPELSSPTTES